MILLIFACASDVSIMKRQEPESNLNETGLASLADSASSTDSFIDGTSGYLHYYLRQVACPSCVGESQEITLTMTLETHEPISDSHTLWIPNQGECTNTFQYITPSTNSISLGDTLYVQSIHSLSLYQGSPGSYSATLYESQYDRNYNYSVSSSDSLLFAFQSLHGFDTIEPYSMLYVDPSYAFQTPIQRTGATFWWTPYGDSNQTFNITIAAYSPDGSQFLGYATCSGADSGQLTVPGQYLANFPSGSLAAIHLTRHKVALEPSDYLNSYIETHMEWEVVGTGFIQ